MSYDLDYFKEFLENPSAYSLGGFYRTLKEWALYLSEHRDEINWLKDEKWREKRERLNAEFIERENERIEVEEEWEEIGEIEEDNEHLSEYEFVAFLSHRLKFMITYQDFFGFGDEDIQDSRISLIDYAKSIEEAEIVTKKLEISKKNLEKSLDNLEQHLDAEFARTGKMPKFQLFRGIKSHKGN